jgi:hypothetical protein
MIDTALLSISVAIENIDLFGRNVPFKWGNGRDVIEFVEHKEVMKILLYWQREVEIYKELYIDKKGREDDTTG